MKRLAGEYALRLGDDALILAQRLSEWSSRAPALEEDLALTNIALDQLGQARALLTLAGSREGRGRSEDDLAFLRNEREFRNTRIVEQAAEDFAFEIARLLIVAAYQHALYTALAESTDPDLAAIAAKAVKEVTYHREHAAGWTIRLGDGTAESRRRIESALAQLWPYRHELFETDELTAELVAAGVAPEPDAMRAAFDAFVGAVLERATLATPDEPSHRPTGGRRGLHGEALGHVLAEMQSLHRAHAGVTW